MRSEAQRGRGWTSWLFELLQKETSVTAPGPRGRSEVKRAYPRRRSSILNGRSLRGRSRARQRASRDDSDRTPRDQMNGRSLDDRVDARSRFEREIAKRR